MSVHRIDHAVVLDTDEIPGRGGYSVVGMSPRVSQAERAFIAGNFGISDYLHDPKTEERVFFSVFRVPGGRRALVRRFARGSELRRNNTQRRLVVHTLLLDEEVWNDLYALPWLLLNARLQYEGTSTPYRLSAEVPQLDPLPALVWDSSDGAASNIAQKIASRLTVIGNQLAGRAPEPRDLLARVITALGSRTRVTLPQEPGYEWATLLAWSMLPRHDRDELAWTQHDATNLSGVTFPLANAVAFDFDAAQRPAAFAEELVRMSTESEESWLDLHERTSRDPLSVRRPNELDAWMRWRNALLRLRGDIRASEAEVVARMEELARTAGANPRASWMDAEEVLRLIWPNVPDAIAAGQTAEQAVLTWGRRLRRSGLGDVIFRAAPTKRWLARAAQDVGADPLVWFFLTGGGEDAASKETRAAIAEWLVSAQVRDVDPARAVMLAWMLATDRSPLLQPLVELLLERPRGLDALLDYLRRREGGGSDLVHAAAPVVLRRNHPGTLEFLRDVFVPRFDRARVDASLAGEVAPVLRDEPASLARFLERLAPEVAAPLAVALAQAGEPARTWFDVLLRVAQRGAALQPAHGRAEGPPHIRELIAPLRAARLDLTGAMDRLLPVLESERVDDSIRALILLLRPVWGGSRFAEALIARIDHARTAAPWEEIVLAYAADRRENVSGVAAAFWVKVDPSQFDQLDPRTIALLDEIHGPGVRRLTHHWSKRLRALPRGAAADRLLALVQGKGVSYQVEMDLALRDIEQGVATPRTLNRLETAMARLHKSKAAHLFADEVEKYLGDGGAAPRLARLLELFASDEIQPTVRLVLQMHVLPKTLKAMKRRDWNELRTAAREDELLALGAVPPLAYTVGARAGARTAEELERVWRAHHRRDALDALAAGRGARSPWQWLAG